MDTLNQRVSEALDTRRTELAGQIVEREFVRHPELEQRYGKTVRARMLEDTGYHLAYLAQAIAADCSGLFGDYIGWAKVMLAKHGVPGNYLGTLLESTKESLRQELSPELSRLASAYLDTGLQQLPRLPDDVPCFIADGTPLAGLAREYLQTLLQGDRHIATKLILDAAAQGTPVRDIYLHVFQRTQYEIGRLWQVNEISVAQEHYCTAVTQFIMSQLYPYVFAAEKTRGTLVATSVSGDLHEIGVRMVCDFFEMEGWRTHYLGANVPTPSVVQAVVQNQATVLAISVTIAYHVRAVEMLIAAVRRIPACDGLKILVGGYPFKVAPDLWKKIGADGSANDAQGAITLANRFASPSTADTDPGEVGPAVAPLGVRVAPPHGCGQPVAAAKKPAPSAPSHDRRDDHFLAELTRTNSELTNLQRAMARKNADLAASEEKYRALIETTGTGFAILDTRGNVLDANDEFVRQTGYQHLQEITGRSVTEWTADNQKESNAEEIRQCLERGQVRALEVDYVDRDGKITPVEINATVIETKQGKRVMALCRDITVRRKLAEALQRQQTELRVLFDLMPAMIWFKDTHNGILRVNQRVADTAGKSVAEIEGKPSVEIYPQEAARFYADDLAVIHSGRPRLGYVETIPGRDGEERWVQTDKVPYFDQAGKVIGIVVMAQDITERKKAEQALQESKERFSGAFEHAPIGVALLSPEGRWIKVNRALCDLVGYSEAELLVRTFQEITLPEDLEADLENVRQLLAGEIRSYQMEKRYVHARGPLVNVWLTVSLVRDGQGRPLYFIKQIQDITERKQTEKALTEQKAMEERARRALEEAHVLNQSHFVTMVSHEFRTPLGVINTAAHVLGRYADRMSEDDRSAQITEIQRAVARMTQMMEDLLLYGKIETGKMECKPSRVKMEALCRQLIADLASLPGTHSSIVCVVAPAACDVFLDEKILRHIVGNLLSNAVKYSVDAQPVRLEVERLAGDLKEAEDTKSPREDLIHIKVIDSGIGIPAADLARLFESFHRAANVGDRPGTGMGMAIVKQCVDLHRGTISVESREGHGTTVSVRLPVPARKARQDARSPVAHGAGGSDDSLGDITAQVSEPARS